MLAMARRSAIADLLRDSGAVTVTEVESRLMLYGIMYVLIMIFRPNGLLGHRPARRSAVG